MQGGGHRVIALGIAIGALIGFLIKSGMVLDLQRRGMRLRKIRRFYIEEITPTPNLIRALGWITGIAVSVEVAGELGFTLMETPVPGSGTAHLLFGGPFDFVVGALALTYFSLDWFSHHRAFSA